jgi:hypothetical protein
MSQAPGGGIRRTSSAGIEHVTHPENPFVAGERAEAVNFDPVGTARTDVA